MDNTRQELMERLITASNAVNILGGNNIDHCTITGFMDIEGMTEHVIRIENEAKEIENK